MKRAKICHHRGVYEPRPTPENTLTPQRPVFDVPDVGVPARSATDADESLANDLAHASAKTTVGATAAVATHRPGANDVSADVPLWRLPKPDSEDRLVAGVSGAIGREVGVETTYVRAAFVMVGLAGGFGLVLYLASWLILQRFGTEEAYVPRSKGRTARDRFAGFAMVVLGVLAVSVALSQSLFGALAWPMVLLSGAAVVGFGRSADRSPSQLHEITRPDQSAFRVIIGLALLFVGVIVALSLSLSFWQAVSGIGVAALVLVGAGLVFAPMVQSLATGLLHERRRRIRSEERADMAAHLHDSVLQTLTLIQKRSDDSAVVGLARRQERELRSWLFDDQVLNNRLGFRAELERQMAEVEEMHLVPIELVVVGDAVVTEQVGALLRASGEAATNAARHSTAARIDVYAEVTSDAIEVFVRDQGCGFDPALVDPDRAGIRDSITGRMERRGGTAVLHSSPGNGTEVELRLPIDHDHLSAESADL